MIEIKFIYEGKSIPIQCNKNEKMKEIFNKIETEIKNNLVDYIYNGNKINKELKLEEIIKEDDINNINILIYNIDKINKMNKIKSKYVKCPKCQENIRIKFNDYKMKLYDCKNGHTIENISLEEYDNTQEIDISKIICNICKVNNQSKTYNNVFYFCNTCKINICPLCRQNHNRGHNIINYEQKDYICQLHNEIYIKYCHTCKKNICLSCHNLHKKHEITQYEDIIPDMNEVENNMNRLNNSIDIFKNDIKKIINNLNKVIDNIDKYYNISNNIIKNYKSKNRNYEILQNINEINNNNNKIINDINNINNDNNIINKLKEIFNIYKKMNNYEIIQNVEKSETQVTLKNIKKCKNNMNNINNVNNNKNDLNSLNNMNSNNNINLNLMNNMNNMNIDLNSMNNMNNMNIDLNSMNNMNNNNFNNMNNKDFNNMNNNIDFNNMNNNNMIKNNNDFNRINYMNNINNNNINMNNMNKNKNDLNRMNNMNIIYNMNRMNNNMNNLGFNNQNNMNNQMNPPNLNQNFNNDEKKIEQRSMPIYPNKTGLKNIGNASYMNSIIQCLSNINYLSDYLRKHFGKFDIDKQPLSVAFSSLVYDLFITQKKYIEPQLFKKIIGELNPLFKGNHEVDAKDLIIFLLEILHQELNKINYSDPANIDYAQLEKDSFDENKMFQQFIKDYTEKNRSIISDTFYGFIRSTMMCCSCCRIKYSFKTFNFLVFKLKNVKEFIQKERFSNNIYKLNIYDAFNFDKKEEILDGKNMIFCKICKALTPGIHQQIIYSLPRVLIIILNRGKNNQDFKEEFIFPKELDLNTGNCVIRNDCNNKFYLQSIITHLGQSIEGGHFIAYCRNGPNEEFLCYNDSIVLKATVNEAMSSNIFGNSNEKRTPYILVYHHIN